MATEILQGEAVSTENGNPSYATIGSPLLDYFAGVTRQTDDSEIIRLAKACIDSDLPLAVATFFQKRDCREGTGERKPFILSLGELPAELRWKLYLKAPEYGYWDDLNAFARLKSDDPETLKVIANIFAKHLLDNVRNFPEGLHYPLEKWLPTEGQQDDRAWKGVKRIIQAFNTHNRDSLVLREEIKQKLGVWHQSSLLKVEGSEVKVSQLNTRFGHLLEKAEALPETIEKLTLKDYRKWCSFMRAWYSVVEHFQSEGLWELIDYSQVPSLAFNRNKKNFAKFDPVRFGEFVQSVSENKAKINVARLMPFELVAQVDDGVRDTQWKLVVEETRKFYSGLTEESPFHPQNSLHVVDASGSMMAGLPKRFHVALSMGLLMAEVGKQPLYTFSAEPRRYEPTWSSLTEALNVVRDPNWTTDFKKLIDRVHQDYGQNPPKSIFVYTDGGFDEMCHETPTTAADYIKGKWENPPIFVFWNVAGNTSDFTTTTEHQGIVQVAGFSKDLYRLFTRLTSLDDLKPDRLFRAAVLTERYQPLIDLAREWLGQ